MDVLGDLVARSRRSDDPALVAPRENRRYDYHRFCTTAWKTGNFWRRRGVHASDEVASVGSSRVAGDASRPPDRASGQAAREQTERSDGVHGGATVAVADDPEPEAVFAFLGAALLGARTRFGLPDASSAETSALDARIVVAPHDEVGDYDAAPGTQRVGYGGPPDDPAVAHFERDVWSENPAFPETAVDPGTVALVAGNRAFSHVELLAAAREVADDWNLEPGDEVAVRAPLAEPGAVVAGVVAPLLAGAAILFPDEDAIGDYAVAEGGAPENEGVRPGEIVR